MENLELSKEKSFEIINEMLSITRKKIIDDGSHFIFWGVSIIICCLIQFVMIEFINKENESNLVWILLPIIGIPMSIFLSKRRKSETHQRNKITNFYKNIWIGFGISLFLVIFLSNILSHSPTPFIMVLIGFAVFLSSVIIDFKPLKIGAIVFWIGAILILFIEKNSYQALFYGFTILVGYVIPGVQLMKKYNPLHV